MAYKILIVEDEAATPLDLEHRLTGWGYTVLGPFARGEQALKMTEQEQPDLALVDIQLAGKQDGVGVAGELKARWGIPVVYLTALATDQILERAKATAPLGYVVKPCTERELRTTLEMALAKLEVDRQLRARETELEQFKTTLDGTHDAVFMFRPDTLRYFYVNQAACAQVGYREAELLAMHAYDLKPKYDEAQFRELLIPLLAGREASLRIELMHRRKDGTDLPVEMFLQLIAPLGEPARFVNICTDITVRKQAQKYAWAQLQLEKRNARVNLARLRLESLASDIGAALNSGKELGAVLKDCADTIAGHLEVALVRIWTLGEGEQVLELQASAGRGQPPEGLHRHVPVGKDDIGRVAKDRSRLFAAPVASDARATDPEWVKREKVVAFGGYPLLVEHRVVGVLAVYSRDDLTPDVQRALDRVAGQIALGIHRKWLQAAAEQTAEQKILEAHENLKRVLDGSEDAVLILDERKVVLFANRAAKGLFGKRLAEVEELGYVLLPGEVEELDVLQPDGSHKVVEMRMGAAQWMSAPTSIITFRDVTERSRAALALAKARDEAIRANNAKSEFLATMSHEIRTPMNGLLGMTELLQQTQLDARQRELVDSVASSGKALLDIINDILDLSKIEAGRMTLHEEEFELRPLVEGVVALMGQATGDKPLVVRAEFDAALPVRFRGDVGRLRQVLLNLVGNGVKFTPCGSVTARARWLGTPDGPARLRFEVSDTGVGIPEAKRALLFQPFQQLDASPTRRHGGTGLGLAISRRLVEMMGGKLDVESEEGKGSTFWFELPLAMAESPQPEPLTGRRVLLAQDHALQRRLTRLSLEKLGCHTEAVATGQEVLQRLAAEHYDVVLFETRLADLDGGALAAAIREREKAAAAGNRPPVRLLALAPGGNTEAQDRLAASGVEVIRESPLTPTVLAKVLAA